MNRVLLSVLALAACNGDKEPEVTWTEVGPVVEAHCAACHTSGGIGPFELDNYDSAKDWGTAIVASTQARSMPPFLVRGDDTCGDFQDNHWLTDEELKIVSDWVDDGTPEGDGYSVSVPELPSLAGETTDHTTPDFLPEIVGGDYAEFDEYRCFMVDMELDDQKFLTGYEVIPGNAAIVHHVIGMPVDLDAAGWNGRTPNREIIERLSSAQPDRDGWPCFEGVGEGVSFDGEVVSWAPGQGPVLYPEGVGLSLPAGTQMVYQVHYNLSDPANVGTRDQTTIKLQIADETQRVGYVILPDLFLAGRANIQEIPAGQANASVSFELPLRWITGELPLDFQLLGVLPHMHERGRQMSMTIGREDGTEDCAAQVENWDFNWQRMYLYETPIEFDASDTLKVECTYDTTGDTEPTQAGWGTQNEMCLPGVLVSIAN